MIKFQRGISHAKNIFLVVTLNLTPLWLYADLAAKKGACGIS
jgi:hypothetical protein